MPVPALVSILHRISGAACSCSCRSCCSCCSPAWPRPTATCATAPRSSIRVVKLVLIGLLWAYLHHFFAGLRFLALDVHYGVELQAARNTSWAVLAASLVLTVILGVWLW